MAPAVVIAALLGIVPGASAAHVASVSGKSRQHDPDAGLSVTRTAFGQTVEPYTGKETEVYQYKLSNAEGMSVQILTYGAIVQAIDVPDHLGQTADVVLGLDNLQHYVADDSPPVTANGGPYLGELLGRTANRIANGTFMLNQPGVGPVTYTVPVNSGTSSLNGGLVGFGDHIWADQEVQGTGFVGVQLTLVSPNGDASGAAGSPGCPNACTGYPALLKTVVTYELNDQNELSVSYKATNESSNLNTVVNLTNASYFNLAGENAPPGSAYEQEVEINGDNYTPVNTSQIPLGQEGSVLGTPLDFTTPQTIGSRIGDTSASPDPSGNNQLEIAGGYDFNWALNAQTQATTGPDGLNLAARAIDPTSGRELSVWTDQPGVQFDTANQLNGTLPGISADTYRQSAGYAFETQHFPDSPNQASFPSTELDASDTFKTATVYQFSSPGIAVSAPASGTAGTSIAASSIGSTLSGATGNASGTISYTVFGPQSSPPTDCTSGGTMVGTAAVSGDGTYHPSAGYTPPSAGTYYWYASYNGDGGDQPASSACGTGMTSTVVAPSALSRLSVHPHKLSIAGRKVHGKCVSQTRKNTLDKRCLRPIKLTVGYTIGGAAAVTFTVHRSRPGREVKGKCVTPTTKNKHRKRCMRPMNVKGKLTKTARGGANSFAWNGKIGGRALAPGRYELTATPAGGAAKTVRFKIVG